MGDMTDPIVIPIQQILLIREWEGDEDVEYVILEPSGRTSALKLRADLLYEQLGDHFPEALTTAELIETLSRLRKQEPYVAIQGGGWALGLREVHGERSLVSLDHREAQRLPPSVNQATIDTEQEAYGATITDVSVDGHGCALECDEAGLQALLTNNVFNVGPWSTQPQPAQRVEIEVRSVTRHGDRFRVGCQVKGDADKIKRLLS